MIFTALGGGHQIGGSCYLIEFEGKTLVIDCGIAFEPKNRIKLPNLKTLKDKHIDVLFVTHCHNDHVGALPVILRDHPETRVFATAMTKTLIEMVLGDSLMFNEENEGEPWFSWNDLDNMIRRIETVEMGAWITLWPNFEVNFWRAGHMPGAASILIRGVHKNLMASGDISLFSDALTKGAELPQDFRPHTLITEATNGHLTLPERALEEKRLHDKIREVRLRGGHCLLPAFGVERAPRTALSLANAGFPVNLGGSAVKFFYKPYGLEHENVRAIGRGEYVIDEAMNLIESADPQIVVATPGMLEGGLSRDFAYAWISDRKNAILIPGFQAEDTPGRKLLEIRPGGLFYFPERLPGRRYRRVLAEVEKFSLSGHPDGHELSDWIKKLGPSLTIMTHGTPKSFAGLHRKLTELRFQGQTRIGYNQIPILC